MRKSRDLASWNVGDCFIIPLIDGRGLLGQVVAVEPDVLNSVTCALFGQVANQEECPTPDLNRLFSVLFTTRDLLDQGKWRIVGCQPVAVPRSMFPYERLRDNRFIGAKVIGSRNVVEFANAFIGLSAWNDWADAEYLDRLLISPDIKPTGLINKNK